MKKIKGKIVNYNETFLGEIIFNSKIKEIKKIKNVEEEIFIIPGFIDLHCHGAKNSDTMNGIKDIKQLANFHLEKGTTSLLPTTWTNNLENTYKALENFNSNFLNKIDSNVLGVHLEGPFINPDKLGAQPPLTQKPNIDFINQIEKIAKIRVITLAPELEGSEKFVDELIKRNIRVQIGHSLAKYDCCVKFINKYLIGFTHLYNAMSGNDHRNPGVLSAALNKAAYSEIICDLIHVNEPAIKIASKCIPNLYAVTDSMTATGMPDGTYNFANLKVEKKNNLAVIKNSSTLAGSVIDMHKTFLNLIKINFSMEKAVAMTSYNASKYLGLNDIGKIKEEFNANFVIMDKNYNIKNVYLNGKKINI